MFVDVIVHVDVIRRVRVVMFARVRVRGGMDGLFRPFVVRANVYGRSFFFGLAGQRIHQQVVAAVVVVVMLGRVVVVFDRV